MAIKSYTSNNKLLIITSFCRFKSSLGWAVESSPVPESAGRSGVRVGGSTLVAAAAPDTPLRNVANIGQRALKY